MNIISERGTLCKKIRLASLRVYIVIRHTEYQVIQVTEEISWQLDFCIYVFLLSTLVPVRDKTKRKSIVESKSDLLGTSIYVSVFE